MKTIAIDFDGVIHKYSKGWHDGTCYDEPTEGAEIFLRDLMKYKGVSVFILSTRSPKQIEKWLIKHMPFTFGPLAEDCSQINGGNGWGIRKIPFWVKFWDNPDVIGITQKKLPAVVYIDDRAIRFTGSWKDVLDKFSSMTLL